MQLERIDTQPRGETAEHPGAVILGQIFGQRQTGIGNVLFGSAIGAAGPIGRVEQLTVGGHRLDTGQRIGGAHQPHHLLPARTLTQQSGHFLDIAVRCRTETGDDIHRIAKLLQHGIVRDGADLAQIQLAVGGKV